MCEEFLDTILRPYYFTAIQAFCLLILSLVWNFALACQFRLRKRVSDAHESLMKDSKHLPDGLSLNDAAECYTPQLEPQLMWLVAKKWRLWNRALEPSGFFLFLQVLLFAGYLYFFFTQSESMDLWSWYQRLGSLWLRSGIVNILILRWVLHHYEKATISVFNESGGAMNSFLSVIVKIRRWNCFEGILKLLTAVFFLSHVLPMMILYAPLAVCTWLVMFVVERLLTLETISNNWGFLVILLCKWMTTTLCLLLGQLCFNYAVLYYDRWGNIRDSPRLLIDLYLEIPMKEFAQHETSCYLSKLQHDVMAVYDLMLGLV